jgi:hypothetical protein
MTYARARQRVNRTRWIAVCKRSFNVVNVCICLYVLPVIVVVNIVRYTRSYYRKESAASPPRDQSNDLGQNSRRDDFDVLK